MKLSAVRREFILSRAYVEGIVVRISVSRRSFLKILAESALVPVEARIDLMKGFTTFGRSNYLRGRACEISGRIVTTASSRANEQMKSIVCRLCRANFDRKRKRLTAKSTTTMAVAAATAARFVFC